MRTTSSHKIFHVPHCCFPDNFLHRFLDNEKSRFIVFVWKEWKIYTNRLYLSFIRVGIYKNRVFFNTDFIIWFHEIILHMILPQIHLLSTALFGGVRSIDLFCHNNNRANPQSVSPHSKFAFKTKGMCMFIIWS